MGKVVPIKPRRKRSDGRRGNRGELLELCVKALRMKGIHAYTRTEFKRLERIPDRYVLTNHPHPSLYGTPGRKEAYIYLDGEEFIVETKYQAGTGSVDEKLPHVFECFLASEIANWIVVFNGRYWKNDLRGKAALKWFRNFVAERRVLHAVPDNRKLYICSLDEFYGLKEWGDK